MGKNTLAEKIIEEIEVFGETLASYKGGPRNIRMITNLAVSNVTCNIIFGRRYDYADPQFQECMRIFNELMQLLKGTTSVNFFPFLRHLPGDLFNIKKFINHFNTIFDFSSARIAEQKAMYDPHNIDGFVSAYLNEMEKKTKSGTPHMLDEINLNRIIGNLFLAGTETTSTTILWCILYALNKPEIQEKVYEEIVDVVGTERLPTMADKIKLKYLTATIMESQRMSSILPLSVQHATSGEVKIGPYTIPAGIQVLPHLDSALCDPEVWGDPDNFRPERFFDEKGNITKPDEFIPFSLGRRVCLGEALANMELFLFLAAMFQRFQFLPVDSRSPPPIKELFGITCAPADFEVRCIERNR